MGYISTSWRSYCSLCTPHYQSTYKLFFTNLPSLCNYAARNTKTAAGTKLKVVVSKTPNVPTCQSDSNLKPQAEEPITKKPIFKASKLLLSKRKNPLLLLKNPIAILARSSMTKSSKKDMATKELNVFKESLPKDIPPQNSRKVPSSLSRTPSLMDLLHSKSSKVPPLTLSFLGTASSSSTLSRNTSSLAVQYGFPTFPTSSSNIAVSDSPAGIPRFAMIFDCGDGTTRQVHKCPDLQARDVTHIFITHLHGDHCFGLLTLAMTLKQNDKPLFIYGPQGLERLFAQGLSQAHPDVHLTELLAPKKLLLSPDKSINNIRDRLSLKKEFHTANISRMIGSVTYKTMMPTVAENGTAVYTLVNNSYLSIRAVPIEHNVFTLGYILEEKPYEDDPSLVPRKIVILGDTSDASAILPFAKGADILVHEATFLDLDQHQAFITGHSTASMTGEFAAKCQPKKLLINHLSGRYFKNETEIDTTATSDLLLEQVSKALKGTKTEVVLAQDFMILAVHPRPQDELEQGLPLTSENPIEETSLQSPIISDSSPIDRTGSISSDFVSYLKQSPNPFIANQQILMNQLNPSPN